MHTAHVHPIPNLVTPAAGRDQWLRCAAACLAPDLNDRELWLSVAGAGLYRGCSVVCGTQRTRVRSCVQEEKERKVSEHGVACLLDPGSNAHLTNVKGVLKAGSVVPCYVEVQGLSGDNKIAKEKGKYEYKLNENEKVPDLICCLCLTR